MLYAVLKSVTYNHTILNGSGWGPVEHPSAVVPTYININFLWIRNKFLYQQLNLFNVRSFLTLQ